jgi:hypothetical protein
VTRYCDLCQLVVKKESYTLETKDGKKYFCCEACLGIYQLIHDDEEPEGK